MHLNFFSNKEKMEKKTYLYGLPLTNLTWSDCCLVCGTLYLFGSSKGLLAGLWPGLTVVCCVVFSVVFVVVVLLVTITLLW